MDGNATRHPERSEGSPVIQEISRSWEVPADLFIPPDALEVFLDSFSGPLDLLLYLIKRQNIDILDIPISEITAQYIQYIEWMEAHKIALAADYLVMAAMLMEIKSKLLLPYPIAVGEEIEDDPRAELVRRLQQYEQFKQAATTLDTLPRRDRDIFPVYTQIEERVIEKSLPEVTITSLMDAMQNLLKRQNHLVHHQIQSEPLSVRERMNRILLQLASGNRLELSSLFEPEEARNGLVVSLLAILELAKQSLLVITQATAFSFVYVNGV